MTSSSDGDTPEDRLEALGLALPALSAPRGRYVRARRHGGILYLAGHGPPPDATGRRPTGTVGIDLSVEDAVRAARGAGLALLATMAMELGALSRVAAILAVRGYVTVGPGIVETPLIVDGCSDLLIEVLGPDVGAHVRSAIGVAALPYGLPVEIEAVVAIRD